MSNQNTGDKPQITANWRIRRFNEEHEDAPFFVEADLPSAKQNGHYPTVEVLQEDYGNHNGYTHEIRLADAELMVLACNLSQKYGSLEAMEQQLIGLKEQHHNDILLAQAASEQITKLEKRVKELEGALTDMNNYFIHKKNVSDKELCDILNKSVTVLTPKQ